MSDQNSDRNEEWRPNGPESNDEASNGEQSFTTSSHSFADGMNTIAQVESDQAPLLSQHPSAVIPSFHEVLPAMKKPVTSIYIQLPGHGNEKQKVNVHLTRWEKAFDAAYLPQLRLLRRENILRQLGDDEVAKQRFLLEEQATNHRISQEQNSDDQNGDDHGTNDDSATRDSASLPPPYWLPHLLANDAYYLERVLRVMYGWSVAPPPPQKPPQAVSFLDKNSGDGSHTSEPEQEMKHEKDRIVVADMDPARRGFEDFRHSGAFEQESENDTPNARVDGVVRTHRASTAAPTPSVAHNNEAETTLENSAALRESVEHADHTGTISEASKPTTAGRAVDTPLEPIPAFPHANYPLYVVYERNQNAWYLLDLHPSIALHRRQTWLQQKSCEQHDNQDDSRDGLDDDESDAATDKSAIEEDDGHEDDETAHEEGVNSEYSENSDKLTSEIPSYDFESLIELDTLILAALQSPIMLRYCLIQPQAPSLANVEKYIERDADVGLSILSTIATTLHGIRARDASRLLYQIPQLALDYNIFFASEFLLSTGPPRPMNCSEPHRRHVDNILSKCSAKARSTIQFLLRAGIVPSRPPLLRVLNTLDGVLLALWLLMIVPKAIVSNWGTMAEILRRQFQNGNYKAYSNINYGQHDGVVNYNVASDGGDETQNEDEIEDDAVYDRRSDAASETAIRRQLLQAATKRRKCRMQDDGPPFLPAPLLIATVLELRRRLARDDCGKAASAFPLDYCLENLCLSTTLEDGVLHGSDPLVASQFFSNEPPFIQTATTPQSTTQHEILKERNCSQPSAAVSDEERSATMHTTLTTCTNQMAIRHQRLYQSDLVLLLVALTKTVSPSPALVAELISGAQTDTSLGISQAAMATMPHSNSLTTVRRRSFSYQQKIVYDAHLRVFARLLDRKMQRWTSPLATLRSGTLRVLFSTLPRFKQESIMRHLCGISPLYELFGVNGQCPLPQLAKAWVSGSQASLTHTPAQQPDYIEIFAATFWHELHFRFLQGHYSANEMHFMKARMVVLLNKVEEFYHQYRRCLQLLGSEKCRYTTIYHSSGVSSNASGISTGSKVGQHSTVDDISPHTLKAPLLSPLRTKVENEKFTGDLCQSVTPVSSIVSKALVGRYGIGITLLYPDPYSVELKKEMIRVASCFNALPMAPRSYFIPETLYTLLFESEYIDLVAVRFMMCNNVSSVRTDPFNDNERLALEYALMENNSCVASLLVGLGMSLSSPVDGGAFTTETLAERQLGSPVAHVLRETWYTNQTITTSDPSKQFGILRASTMQE